MKKIAVIGSINMDMTAAAERIPRPGETIRADNVRYVPGGKGANQAVAAARLGGDVTMFGCVGDDAFGTQLIGNLRSNNINTDHVDVAEGSSSGLAMIVVAEGDNAITVIPGANARVTPEYIDKHWEAVLGSDIVLLQNEIPEDAVSYAVERLHAAGKDVIYNPAPSRMVSRDMLEKVRYFTPNEHELRCVLGDETTPLEDLVTRFNGRLIVTLGSKGIAGYDGEYVRVPAINAEVVDTTGAGDTMNGAFAYALATGMGYRQALSFANAAAGISTEKAGAQAGMPSLDEVERRLSCKD